jgi:hypothetical protein
MLEQADNSMVQNCSWFAFQPPSPKPVLATRQHTFDWGRRPPVKPTFLSNKSLPAHLDSTPSILGQTQPVHTATRWEKSSSKALTIHAGDRAASAEHRAAAC